MKLQVLVLPLFLAVGISSVAQAADCNLQNVAALSSCIVDENGGGTQYSMVYRLSTDDACTMARGSSTPHWEFADYLSSNSLETGSAASRAYRMIKYSVPTQSYQLTTTPSVFVCVRGVGKNANNELVASLTADFLGPATNFTYTVTNAANPGQRCQSKTIPGSLGDPALTYDQYAVNTYGLNFAALCAGAASPLPVTLISFAGNTENSSVRLQWKTSSEVGFSNFDIERSTSGYQFSGIARVNATGASGGIQNYQYLDQNINLSGNIFYRLKMNDIDGRFKYSNVIKIQMDSKERVALTPNPLRAGNSASLAVSGYSRQAATISIFSQDGKLIGNRSVQIVEGSQVLSIPRSDVLNAGIYFVVLTTKDGVKQSHRLVIQ